MNEPHINRLVSHLNKYLTNPLQFKLEENGHDAGNSNRREPTAWDSKFLENAFAGK